MAVVKTGAAKMADLGKVAATFRSQVQCGHRRYTKPPRAEEKRRDFGPAYLCRDHATVLWLSVFSIERRCVARGPDLNRLHGASFCQCAVGRMVADYGG